MPADFRPWFDAWNESAYGEAGFWPGSNPGEHFRTASALSEVMVDAVLSVLPDQPALTTVVELGAGEGQLLSGLARRRPELDLFGVDLRDRPQHLIGAVGWRQDRWDVTSGRWLTGAAQQLLAELSGPTLIICAEWLDDLPCAVASRTGQGLRTTEVDQTGRERLGVPLPVPDREWATQWWPTGNRLEVGRTRDLAWAAALQHLRPYGGFGLVIDYGHLTAERPPRGSLTAYARGRGWAPVPSGELNLTATVAVDALAEAGHGVGAHTLLCARQREVLAGQHLATPLPDPLADLVRRSERAALADVAVWGDQWWLLQQVPAAS